MKQFKHIVAGVFIVLGMVVSLTAPTLAYDPIQDSEACKQDPSKRPAVCGDLATPKAEDKVNTTVENVVNLLIYIIGAISVIMIVIGGIRYTTSNGDSSAISGAKNTILYSVVGLIVALSAYAIVNFVLNNL